VLHYEAISVTLQLFTPDKLKNLSVICGQHCSMNNEPSHPHANNVFVYNEAHTTLRVPVV